MTISNKQKEKQLFALIDEIVKEDESVHGVIASVIEHCDCVVMNWFDKSHVESFKGKKMTKKRWKEVKEQCNRGSWYDYWSDEFKTFISEDY